jgi:hypothetical protein
VSASAAQRKEEAVIIFFNSSLKLFKVLASERAFQERERLRHGAEETETQHAWSEPDPDNHWKERLKYLRIRKAERTQLEKPDEEDVLEVWEKEVQKGFSSF